MGDKENLKTLLPTERIELSNGTGVDVTPVPFGKMPIFSDAVVALIKTIRSKGIKLEDIDDWKILFDIAFEETVKIMGLVIEKDREFFNQIEMSDGLAILDVIVKQNVKESIKKNIASLTNRVSSMLKTSSNS
jgi:hypothetical protein